MIVICVVGMFLYDVVGISIKFLRGLSLAELSSTPPQILVLTLVSVIFVPILIHATILLIQIKIRKLEHLVIVSESLVFRVTLADSGLSYPLLIFAIFPVALGMLAFVFPEQLSAPASVFLGFFGICAAVIKQDLRGVLNEAA